MVRNYLREVYSDAELKLLLKKHFDNGHTVKEVAQIIGSTERTVSRWRNEFGLTSKPLDVKVSDVVIKHNSGMSANDISKEYGVSVDTIVRRLQKGGVSMTRIDGIRRKQTQRQDAMWPSIENDLNLGFLKSEIIEKYKMSAPTLNKLISRHGYKRRFVGDVSDIRDILNAADDIINIKRRRSTIEYLSAILDYIEEYDSLPTCTDLSQYMGRSIQTVASWFRTNKLKHLLGTGTLVSYRVRHMCRILDGLGVTYSLNNRKIISPYEIDIWLPDYNLGFEINPSTTHTVTKGPGISIVDKMYHQMKSLMCLKSGVRLHHVFDWDSLDEDIVGSILSTNESGLGEVERFVLDLNAPSLSSDVLEAHGYIAHQILEPVERLVNRNNSKLTTPSDTNAISVYDAGKIIYVKNV